QRIDVLRFAIAIVDGAESTVQRTLDVAQVEQVAHAEVVGRCQPQLPAWLALGLVTVQVRIVAADLGIQQSRVERNCKSSVRLPYGVELDAPRFLGGQHCVCADELDEEGRVDIRVEARGIQAQV